jgi:hypothetical protein
MESTMAEFPFEATPEQILRDPDPFVDAVFACLESEFLAMPRGVGFVAYPVFERGYEALKRATLGFSDFTAEKVLDVSLSEPVALIVLRTMLGFSPPEWGYVATQRCGVLISQGFVRALDRNIRMNPNSSLKAGRVRQRRLKALVLTACELLEQGAPSVQDRELHRFDKADTEKGLVSLRNAAAMGVPYAMLLYERFLGRPFAGHRDSVSELVGDRLESAIEEVLAKAGTSYRKTKRAERIIGFDQAPDFIAPSEFNPRVVIEAKITEDDGTARDKVTRIQPLGELSMAGRTTGEQKYEVVACLAGRGFGVRREDMRKVLAATHGKVFTMRTLDQMVPYTRLKEFTSR